MIVILTDGDTTVPVWLFWTVVGVVVVCVLLLLWELFK